MQHADAVDSLPSYPDSLDNEKPPCLIQEKWADIEATLPPYEERKPRSIRPRIRSRKQCIRIAFIVCFILFLVTPAAVLGCVYGLRAQHKTQAAAPAPVPSSAPQSAPAMPPSPSDGAIATGVDGKPVRGPMGFGSSTIPPPASATKPPGFEIDPRPTTTTTSKSPNNDKDSAEDAPERG